MFASPSFISLYSYLVCLSIAQDENAYKKDDSNASGSGNPQAFYPDGITPPTRNIVKRRFLRARPDQGKFDRTEVGLSNILEGVRYAESRERSVYRKLSHG